MPEPQWESFEYDGVTFNLLLDTNQLHVIAPNPDAPDGWSRVDMDFECFRQYYIHCMHSSFVRVMQSDKPFGGNREEMLNRAGLYTQAKVDDMIANALAEHR